MLELLAAVALVLAGFPAILMAANLLLYRRPRSAERESLPAVSVLIPARDEESSIAGAVTSALASTGVELEVVVMDDGSTDRTAEIVRTIGSQDSRVRFLQAPALPPGWCGKQHACFALSRAARHPVLVFVDADVRLEPAGLCRIVAEIERRDADLISGIPRQVTGTWMEHLLIPLIHFVLLGYLPMIGMRLTRSAAFAAGCGQLMAVRREAYELAGGHAAIHDSRHDGIMLPRAFRRERLKTDLFDATTVASCRMYQGAHEVWNGLAKNATEGMAGTAAIGPWTLLLLGGQVLPWLLLVPAMAIGGSAPVLLIAAIASAYAMRFVAALRFGQSRIGALLHPVGVAILVAIQWFAWARQLCGRQIAWKGRARVQA